MTMSTEELIKAFEEEHDDRRQRDTVIQEFNRREPPSTLYHYTTAEGLKGIVESGSIWCTNAAFFNDASEIAYGLNQVDRALNTIPSDSAFVGIESVLHDAIQKSLDVYAACFCKRGDLLNQWHSYGGRGGGFSIGLTTCDLASILPGTDLVLCEVEYDPDVQISLIQAQIGAASEALKYVMHAHEPGSVEHEGLVNHSINAVLSSVSIVVAAMKDPVFRGEEESRLVHYRSRLVPQNDDVSFRISGQLMIPYIATNIRCHDRNVPPIHELIIGPMVNRLAERSLKYFLSRFGDRDVQNVELRRSVIPLQAI